MSLKKTNKKNDVLSLKFTELSLERVKIQRIVYLSDRDKLPL